MLMNSSEAQNEFTYVRTGALNDTRSTEIFDFVVLLRTE